MFLKISRNIWLKQILRHITNGNSKMPCSGILGSVRLGHGLRHSHASLHHILPALVFAAQSPYPGWQNVSYL